MTHDADKPLVGPHDFPRRILLATVGLNPQVVTETAYALAVRRRSPFVATEIHVITTAKGAELTASHLLPAGGDRLGRLASDHGLPALRDALIPERIRVVEAQGMAPLADILDEAANDAVADLTMEVVRSLTGDPKAALHVSLAGGRKTMGYLLGSALNLFGRAQDRMSHVLVDPQLERDKDFFYPLPDAPADAADGIRLANIQFIRLRRGLPEDLLSGRSSYSETVARAQQSLIAPSLLIDLERRCIACHGVEIRLEPQLLALYALLADMAVEENAGEPFHWSNETAQERFVASYSRLPRLSYGALEGLRERLKGDEAGFEFKALIEQAKAKLNRAIAESW
jgi:CRISPR-associated protein (TIGR02584 family)